MSIPSSALEIWVDPRDAESLRAQLDAALGADRWCESAPEEALLGIFNQPDIPVDLDPFLPLIALHPETSISSMGAWLQRLADPDAEALADAVETLAALREMEVFDRDRKSVV